MKGDSSRREAWGGQAMTMQECAWLDDQGWLSSPQRSFSSPSFMQSDSYQEDIYPMTPGTEPALTPDEWLGGINRGTSAGRHHRRAQEAAGSASP